MKKIPRPPCSWSVPLLALLAAVTDCAALTPTEWRYRQSINLAAPGLTKVTLHAATFDSAQPALSDLRLIDAQGQEIPYLLDRDLYVREYEPARLLSPKSFSSTPKGDTTQITFETGTTDLLDAIDLETSVPYFLKAAHVEISTDGTAWQSLGPATPVFRQFGAEQMRLSLDRQRASFVRVTMDDFRSRHVDFAGARLLPVPTRAAPPPLIPLGARITRRDEFAGETVLTITLDGRHVLLAGLTFDTKDPLFMHRVTIAIREVQGAISSERVIASGTIYRVALEGAPARAQLGLPLEFSPPTRELLVHIHNGDSLPLALDSVQASQHPVNLLFLAPKAGPFLLLSGNAQAVPPHYDLAAFAGEMRGAGAAIVVPADVEAMPDYHPRESPATAPLPDVPLRGAPLDVNDWPYRRAIHLSEPGVQELELDLQALAQSRPDYADLRLLRDGNQIPYVLEQPALARSLKLTAEITPDAKRPSISVWRLALPQTRLPLRRIVLTSATPLFQRQFRLFEKLTAANGRVYDQTVASGSWSRVPGPGVPENRIFELQDRLQTDMLWIETDNGDNPAIELGPVQTVYPVVRLIFKTGETQSFTLAAGKQAITPPRYDLSMVAVKLLTSSRNVAQLAAGGLNGIAKKSAVGIKGGFIFWGALALVVIVLLMVVAKLLPKPPPAE